MLEMISSIKRVMFKALVPAAVILVAGLSMSGTALASGSFVPSGAGPGNASFNAGKAIFYGRSGDGNCVSCHAKFKRSKLKALPSSVSEKVVNCDVHTPCFSSKLDSDQLRALDAYFMKRYRLK